MATSRRPRSRDLRRACVLRHGAAQNKCTQYGSQVLSVPKDGALRSVELDKHIYMRN